jgi:peptidyl-prolyl cis-trans isomerase SurA
MNLTSLSHHLLLPTLILVGHCSTLSQSMAETNGLAATVNGTAITKAEVEERLKPQFQAIDAQVPEGQRAELKAKFRKESLDDLINKQLLLGEYKKLSGGQPLKSQYLEEEIKDLIRKKYDGDRDKFLKSLKEYGMSYNKFRETQEKMLTVQMIKGHLTKEVGVPTPDKKEAFLKKHEDLFRGTDYIKLRSITVGKFAGSVGSTPADQKTLVKEIRQRVIKGADFASEAKTYSNDSHASAGGDWGTIDRSAMSAKMAKAAFALDAKSISDIIEDEENFYLFYVEAKQPGKMKPASEIEPELEAMVQNEERSKVLNAWLDRARSKANIKLF